MKELKNEELLKIIGGSVSAAMIASLVRGINALLDLGRSLGSAIRRVKERNICPL